MSLTVGIGGSTATGATDGGVGSAYLANPVNVAGHAGRVVYNLPCALSKLCCEAHLWLVALAQHGAAHYKHSASGWAASTRPQRAGQFVAPTDRRGCEQGSSTHQPPGHCSKMGFELSSVSASARAVAAPEPAPAPPPAPAAAGAAAPERSGECIDHTVSRSSMTGLASWFISCRTRSSMSRVWHNGGRGGELRWCACCSAAAAASDGGGGTYVVGTLQVHTELYVVAGKADNGGYLCVCVHGGRVGVIYMCACVGVRTACTYRQHICWRRCCLQELIILPKQRCHAGVCMGARVCEQWRAGYVGRTYHTAAEGMLWQPFCQQSACLFERQPQTRWWCESALVALRRLLGRPGHHSRPAAGWPAWLGCDQCCAHTRAGATTKTGYM